MAIGYRTEHRGEVLGEPYLLFPREGGGGPRVLEIREQLQHPARVEGVQKVHAARRHEPRQGLLQLGEVALKKKRP